MLNYNAFYYNKSLSFFYIVLFLRKSLPNISSHFFFKSKLHIQKKRKEKVFQTEKFFIRAKFPLHLFKRQHDNTTTKTKKNTWKKVYKTDYLFENGWFLLFHLIFGLDIHEMKKESNEIETKLNHRIDDENVNKIFLMFGYVRKSCQF